MFIELMPGISKNSNLSIIAVRILPGCRDSVRKCLKENQFYYLNNNYEIDDNGEIIWHQDDFIVAIDDEFFTIDREKKSPDISISAIVGKNGDGKSSLVELMIRIINNFACRLGFNPQQHLIFVKGVYAELYYKLNGRLFRIRISSSEEKDDEVFFQEYSFSKGKYLIGKPSDKSSAENFFYTLVSNYSHFAYNTEEFDDEQDEPEKKSDNYWENHWLHRVFHKNDAYQTPLNLHPFREKGNININKERNLSRQRLLTVIAKTFSKSSSGGYESKFEINGKYPLRLELKDPDFSKFQTVAIKNFLKYNNPDSILDDVRKVFVYRTLETNLKIKWENAVISSVNRILNSPYLSKHRGFFDTALNWLKEENLLKKEDSIDQFIKRVIEERDSFAYDRYAYNQFPQPLDFGHFSVLSLTQLQRLVYINDICNFWKTGINIGNGKSVSSHLSPNILFKHYADLTDEEKAYHYLIYKTISIFETYEPYKSINVSSAVGSFLWRGRSLQDNDRSFYDLTKLFEKLSEDWKSATHITLKLRQTFNFLSNKDSYSDFFEKKEILFKNMSEVEKTLLSNIETLPPPFFNWNLWFLKTADDSKLKFSSFSSGEKQKLFFISAIIYHLQNLNSVGQNRMQFKAVNLIFEEIELYFHPEWQRTLVFDLIKAIRSANISHIAYVNMIFVTHSPYILSDIPKQNVLFLKDGAPYYEMQENTFGANINSLLKNGFFLPSLPMGEFAYKKINSLFAKLHSGKFDLSELDQLYAQIMTVGEPAIRMQLMTLFSPYRIFSSNKEELVMKLKQILLNP